MGKQKGSSQQTQNGAPSSTQQTDRLRKDERLGTRTLPTLKQRIWAKVEASLWVIAASFAVVYGDGYTNLVDLIAYDGRIRRTWLYVGASFLGLNFIVNIYLRIWLQWWKGVDDWVKAAPFAIPVAAFAGLCAGLTLTVALWPVLRYTAPLSVVVMFMGVIMAPHLVPSQWTSPPKKAQ